MEILKNNPKLRNIFILLSLLTLWIFLTVLYIFNYNLSLSVISYSHSKDNFHNYSPERLFAGDKISGSFVAEENYLGIVNINLSVYEQVPYNEEDILVFRLKEKGQKNWYYVNTYRSGLAYEVPFLPFGFPIIENSAGKTYQFELESTRGNEVNAVGLNTWEPVLVSRYQIPREQLLGDEGYLLSFFIKKIAISFANRAVLFFSFIYSLPLFFYVLFFLPPGRNIILPVVASRFKKIHKKLETISILGFNIYPAKTLENTFNRRLHYVLVIVVLINIFIVPALNDMALIIVGTLWYLIVKKYRLSFRNSIIVGLRLLIIAPIMLFFNQGEIAEKASVWAYTFFVVGFVQALIELKGGGITQESAVKNVKKKKRNKTIRTS